VPKIAVPEIIPIPAAQAVLSPAPLFAPTPRAAFRVLEFFTAQVANPHTRQAYWNAARRFAKWCEGHGITALESVHSIHVATFIRELEASMAPPTVKQNLAAIRMLFDWLVSGGILPHNPAHAVRGPKHVVKKGKTPVLTSEETRVLLDSIPTTSMTSSIAGLRDRALIATMVYTFARINAVLGLRVEDYYIQGRRGWMNLREKGGKQHAVPCHHNLEQYLDEYLAAIGEDVTTSAGGYKLEERGIQLFSQIDGDYFAILGLPLLPLLAFLRSESCVPT